MGEINRRIRRLEMCVADALEAGDDDLLNELLDELVFYTNLAINSKNMVGGRYVL